MAGGGRVVGRKEQRAIGATLGGWQRHQRGAVVEIPEDATAITVAARRSFW